MFFGVRTTSARICTAVFITCTYVYGVPDVIGTASTRRLEYFTLAYGLAEENQTLGEKINREKCLTAIETITTVTIRSQGSPRSFCILLYFVRRGREHGETENENVLWRDEADYVLFRVFGTNNRLEQVCFYYEIRAFSSFRRVSFLRLITFFDL